jgi:hypothetical protein
MRWYIHEQGYFYREDGTRFGPGTNGLALLNSYEEAIKRNASTPYEQQLEQALVEEKRISKKYKDAWEDTNANLQAWRATETVGATITRVERNAEAIEAKQKYESLLTKIRTAIGGIQGYLDTL